MLNIEVRFQRTRGRKAGSLGGEEARTESLPVLISGQHLEFPPISSCFLLSREQQHEPCEELKKKHLLTRKWEKLVYTVITGLYNRGRSREGNADAS